jgi:hypothetical protein
MVKEVHESESTTPCEQLIGWNREDERAKLDLLAAKLATFPPDVFGKSTRSITEPLSQFLTVMNRRHGRLIRLQELCGGRGVVVHNSTGLRLQDNDCTPRLSEIENSWGVQLTYDDGNSVSQNFSWCSYRDPVDASYRDFTVPLEQAFNDISNRGVSFSNVFGGVEFRLFNRSLNYAAQVQSQDQIDWNAGDIAFEIRDGLEPHRTVVHELGHILQARAAGDRGMRNTAHTSGGYLILPNQYRDNPTDIATITFKSRPETTDDATTETIADYFMFWVYDAFNTSTLKGRVAQIFMEGGLVIMDRRDQRISYPVALFSSEITYAAILFAIELAKDGLVDLMLSPGMSYWLSSI